DGYPSRPTTFNAVGWVLGDNPRRTLTLSEPSETIQTNIVRGAARANHRYEYTGLIEPAIQPSDRVTYAVRFSAQGGRPDAFSDSGSFASWLVTQETRELEIVVRAPAGSVVTDLSVGAFDESGNKLGNESGRLREPKHVSSDASLVQWKIVLPSMHVRYVIAFRLLARAREVL